jgi:leader peptidase (prepilin peptidase) / N-methyltransferase
MAQSASNPLDLPATRGVGWRMLNPQVFKYVSRSVSVITASSGKSKRRRPAGPAAWLVTAALLALLLYAVVWPLARAAWGKNPVSPAASMDLAETVRLRTLQALTVAWLFYLGACLGSFLNVVIYRCPRRQTLWGTSLCPYCRQPIRFRHNLPVLGWLILRGRCRDCQLPISVRYPLVEATVGTLFLTLALAELFTGGRNLPVQPFTIYSGIHWVVFDPQWPLIALYISHCGLLSVLLSWALIWHDRQRVPPGYVLLVVLVLLFVSALVPAVHPISWRGADLTVARDGAVDGLATAVVGMAGGLGLGILLSLTAAVDPALRDPPDWRWQRAGRHALGLTVAGGFLGWQAVLSLGLLWPVCKTLLRSVASHRLTDNDGVALVLAVWTHIVAWRLLSLIPLWPSHHSSLATLPILVVAALVLTLVLRAARDNRDRRPRQAPAA